MKRVRSSTGGYTPRPSKSSTVFKAPSASTPSEKGLHNTSIRFPKAFYDIFAAAAEERGYSVNFLVVKACEDFYGRLIPVDEIKLTVDKPGGL